MAFTGANTLLVASAVLKSVIKPLVMSHTGTIVAGVGTYHGRLTAGIQATSSLLSTPSVLFLGAVVAVTSYALLPKIAEGLSQMMNQTTLR